MKKTIWLLAMMLFVAGCGNDPKSQQADPDPKRWVLQDYQEISGYGEVQSVQIYKDTQTGKEFTCLVGRNYFESRAISCTQTK
jgi:hypothetical protein